LGLEAACATLTEKGDRVLVMDNGEYGKGFAGFVTMYGGEPVLYSTDPVIIHTHFFTEHGGNGVYQGQDTIFL
jgi:aspartate aminotransferase-like enzyme